MEKIAARITEWLIAKKAVTVDEKEIYAYGVFHLMLNIIDTISIMLLALLFHDVISTVIYILCFCTLRRYAGGYHAKTVITCYLLTLTSSFGMLVLLQQFEIPTAVQMALWIISGIFILLFAPVQNENKILDETEKKVFKKRTIIIWMIQVIAMALLYRLGFSNYFKAILIAHTYIVISLLVEKAKLAYKF